MGVLTERPVTQAQREDGEPAQGGRGRLWPKGTGFGGNQPWLPLEL